MNTPLPYDATIILKAELLAQIDAARDEIERPICDAGTTAQLRGRIQAYRSLLKWIEPPASARPEPDDRRLSRPPNY